MYQLLPNKTANQAAATRKVINIGCSTLLALMVLGTVAGIFVYGMNPSPSAASIDKSDACYMAQKLIKDQLKSPATAEFAPCHEPDTVVSQNGRLWIVQSWVDAQNSFGAQLRNHFTAKVIYYPASDTWTLVESSFATP